MRPVVSHEPIVSGAKQQGPVTAMGQHQGLPTFRRGYDFASTARMEGGLESESLTGDAISRRCDTAGESLQRMGQD